jgi:hypothetical protein
MFVCSKTLEKCFGGFFLLLRKKAVIFTLILKNTENESNVENRVNRVGSSVYLRPLLERNR